MNHLILFVICLISVEIFIRTNSISLINLIINLSKKAIYIILNKNISDHWKENILPKYSLLLMKYSIQMLFILFMIIFIYVIADHFFGGLLAFTLSPNGIIASIFIAVSYAYIRKQILNE